MSFPFLLLAAGRLSADESPDQCQEGRYAGVMYEVTQKGQPEVTCPKVDMPRWRHVLCALFNAYLDGCDSRTRILGP